MANLQLVANNWHPFPKERFIKKLPIVFHNSDDRSILGIRYSVRSRFSSDNQIWMLIRKERENEKTDADVSSVNPDSAA